MRKRNRIGWTKFAWQQMNMCEKTKQNAVSWHIRRRLIARTQWPLARFSNRYYEKRRQKRQKIFKINFDGIWFVDSQSICHPSPHPSKSNCIWFDLIYRTNKFYALTAPDAAMDGLFINYKISAHAAQWAQANIEQMKSESQITKYPADASVATKWRTNSN